MSNADYHWVHKRSMRFKADKYISKRNSPAGSAGYHRMGEKTSISEVKGSCMIAIFDSNKNHDVLSAFFFDVRGNK